MEACTIFTKTKEYRLSDYFQDPDNAPLSYSIGESASLGVRVGIEDGILRVKAGEAGLQKVVLLFVILLKKILTKPKSQLETLVEEKQESRFSGKLDAYVTGQPEGAKEIPPLSFDMYKIKDNKITLGSLMSRYGDVREGPGLDDIYLVADKDCQMILYHTSKYLS